MTTTINASTSAGLVNTADTSGILQLQTTGTAAVTIDASQNVGVGTASPATKLNIVGDNTAFRGQLSLQTSSASNYAQITFYDRTTLQAQIYQDYGAQTFNILNVAATPMLFWTANTERMRIDSSGNLLVGTTTSSGRATISETGTANTLIVANSTVDYYPLVLHNKATSGNNLFSIFLTDAGTSRGSITYNRAAGLVVYATTSDYRAKDIISPLSNSGEVIDSVPVYMGKMKGATQERPMFIAHETPDYAHTGEKDAVDKDGNPVYQQMDASSLVPVLWAEVQSLRKRLTVLEAK